MGTVATTRYYGRRWRRPGDHYGCAGEAGDSGGADRRGRQRRRTRRWRHGIGCGIDVGFIGGAGGGAGSWAASGVLAISSRSTSSSVARRGHALARHLVDGHAEAAALRLLALPALESSSPRAPPLASRERLADVDDVTGRARSAAPPCVVKSTTVEPMWKVPSSAPRSSEARSDRSRARSRRDVGHEPASNAMPMRSTTIAPTMTETIPPKRSVSWWTPRACSPRRGSAHAAARSRSLIERPAM